MRDIRIPRRRVLWETIKTYDVLYRSKPDSKGRVQEVRIKSITRPKRTRTLRVAGGRRKFYAVQASTTTKEFIIMAKATKEKTSKKSEEITDDELKELAALENLEDEVSENGVEPTADADEGDEDTTKTSKKGKAGKKGGKKGKAAKEAARTAAKKRGGALPGESRAAANGKVGTAEIAAAGGTDARTLRMVLRKHEVEKNEETGRYEWGSMKDPAVKKILKLLKDGAAEEIKTEALNKLKERNDAKKKTKDTATDSTNGDGATGEAKKKNKKNKKGKKNKS